MEQSNSHLLVSGPSQTCVGFTTLRIFQLYLVVFVLCMRSRRGLAMDHMYVRGQLAIGILSLFMYFYLVLRLHVTQVSYVCAHGHQRALLSCSSSWGQCSQLKCTEITAII